MSRGKYKRKREHARKREQKDESRVRVVNKTVIATDEAKSSPNATGYKRNDEEESAVNVGQRIKRIWSAVGGYLKLPSFTDYCLTAFTFALAITAIFQYRITDNQLSMMRIDQRAWLDIKEGGPAPAPISGQSMNWPLSMANIGKTVATKIGARFTVAFVDAKQGVPLQCVEVESAGCPINSEVVGIIMPNGNDPIAALWHSAPGVDRIATPEEVEAWNSGKAYVAVFGFASYEDVFKTRHWVRFCYWGSKPGTQHMKFHAYSCTRYNSVDGEYPEQGQKSQNPN